MSEKGVLITDQTGGESIACRDAFETDNDANARIVQRIDFAGGRVPSPLGNASRTMTEIDDCLDVTNLPAGLLSNLVDCGDNSKMVVSVQFLDDGTQTFDVIPIAFDSEVTPNVVAILDLLNFTSNISNSFRRGSSSKNFLDESQTVALNGAHKIGFYAKTMNGSVGCGASLPACLGVSIWASMI